MQKLQQNWPRSEPGDKSVKQSRKRKYDAAKEGNPEAIKWVEAFRASRRKANSKKKEAIERESV